MFFYYHNHLTGELVIFANPSAATTDTGEVPPAQQRVQQPPSPALVKSHIPRVLEAVKAQPGVRMEALRRAVGGTNLATDRARDALVADGRIIRRVEKAHPHGGRPRITYWPGSD